MNHSPILIIGGGLAGLSAAVYLHQRGEKFLLLEAEDRVGGRVKTDVVEGFRLDRGFQVLLTAYPETQSLLNYASLRLCRFAPGAIILHEKGRTEIGDPIRQPAALLKTLLSSAGTPLDKINILRLRQRLKALSLADIFAQPEISTHQALSEYGFSPRMQDRFFQPFMAGIFLENELNTSRRMFDFVFKMFSEGDTAVPALGMEEIPKQLAARLPPSALRLGKRVISVLDREVVCEDGEIFTADKILLATEAPGLAKHYLATPSVEGQSVTCVYFYAEKPPFKKALLALNAHPQKFVNNIAVMSNVSPEYAPPGQALISVSVNGYHDWSREEISNTIRHELAPILGEQVYSWRILQHYPIRYALPSQQSVNGDLPGSRIKLSESLFVAGDYLLNGSINAALQAGRQAAEAILAG